MQGHFLDVNDAYCRLIGYSRDELLTMRIPDIETVETPEETAHRIQKVKKTGGDRFETHHRCKDGRIIDVEISVNYIDAGGGRLFVFARDITERKQAEDAMRESEERYRNLVESISDVVYAIDSSGMLTYISPVVKNTLGYEPDELIGRQFLEFVHKEDHDLLMRRFSELREGIARHSDYRVIGKHADIKWVRTLTNPIIKEGGFVGAHGVLIDITERKQAEEALIKSELRFRNSFDLPLIGFAITSPEKEWIEVNDRICSILGYSRDEIVQRTWLELTHPDDLPADIEQFNLILSGQIEKYSMDKRFIRKDGQVVWTSISVGCVRKPDGRVDYIIGLMEDISERKRAEEQLKSSMGQLRTLSAHLQSIREEERAMMAREIHDELGQELTGLKMDLSWLVKRLSKNQKSLISKTESMLKLVDSTIQTVRKISSKLRPGVLDDLGIVAAIEWQTQDFRDRTGIKCELNSSVEDVELDRDRSTAVFRIFQETLTNVVRHAKATRIIVNVDEDAGNLILRVKDNGRGITESKISHPKSLGLLGMRERVLLFGGEVKISGIPGEGTTVTVTIPLKQGEK
jgi:two-component system sensor histidine kinase UhpB